MTRIIDILKRLITGCSVAIVMLLMCEIALRMLAVGPDLDPRGSTRLFLAGQGSDAGYYVTNPHFLDVVHPQRFSVKKPDGVSRVFIVGGSAAQGWPGPLETSFSGFLKRSLATYLPGRFEIVSATAMSYGSHRVLDLVDDIVELDPDFVVVWSGNNEYVERNSLTAFRRSASGRSLHETLVKSALYRSIITVLTHIAPDLMEKPDSGDITDLRNSPVVRRGMLGRTAKIDRQVLENYRDNLLAMARLVHDHGAKTIFCTVPVNLSGWLPNNTLPIFTSESDATLWHDLRRDVTELIDLKAYEKAVPGLQKMLSIAPRDAVAHYFLGISFQHLWRDKEAAEAFSRARDLDARPIRALSAFNDVVRTVAGQEGTDLVDLEQVFADYSGHNLTGLDLFLDYVHPNEAGNKLAAKAILEMLLPKDSSSQLRSKLLQAIEQDDMVLTADFRVADLWYVQGMTLKNNGDLEAAENSFLSAFQADPSLVEPAAALGNIYKQRGDFQKALLYYQRAVDNDPNTIYALELAMLKEDQGDRRGARELAHRLLNSGVIEVSLYTLLGDIEFKEGRFQQAIAYYRQALANGAEDPAIQMNIGLAFKALGDDSAAQKALDSAGNLRAAREGRAEPK